MPTHADPTYIAFANPLDHPWHFAALELLVFACLAATLIHAARAWRQGNRFPAFRWLAIFTYGVLMELIAFNYWQNYEHGQFTVQLYHRLLPLYVTAVYVVFHYTGLEMIGRMRLGAVTEAFLGGFAICMLDVPFDIVGVDAGWWVWSTKDHDVAFRWLGVPVTSYYWYLLFGAILSALCRGLRARVERGGVAKIAGLAAATALGVVVLGTIAFLPFHAVKALGVREDTVVAAHLAVCAWLAVRARTPEAHAMDRSLAWVPLTLPVFHLVVLGWLCVRGSVADAPMKAIILLVAGGATWALARKGRSGDESTGAEPIHAA